MVLRGSLSTTVRSYHCLFVIFGVLTLSVFRRAHCATVRRLRWRPSPSALELVSCSTDQSVRLFAVSAADLGVRLPQS